MRSALVFFGAFNPPTIAHLSLAEYAMKATGREGVVFVPSKSRFISGEQKKSFAYSEEARLEMLYRLAENRDWMRVSDWEIRQAEQPKTYITLCHLREEGYAPALLMGSDKLEEFEEKWRYVPEILDEFGVVALSRGRDDLMAIIRAGTRLKDRMDRITLIDSPDDTKTISSTRVRSLVMSGAGGKEALIPLVPAEIIDLVWDGRSGG